MKKLRILLIEDDPLECQSITNFIDSIEDIHLEDITNNTTDAIELVKYTLPDAIILDLELHKGGGNGLLFLTSLQKLNLTIRPYILVTTNNISPITHEHARSQGADFIMTKSQSDYSAENVIKFLLSLKETILNNSLLHKLPLDLITLESPKQSFQRILKRIDMELNLIGISPRLLGRQYLCKAIKLTIESHETKVISIIAKEYQKSPASVEQAMQTAINKAWNSSDPEVLLKNYTAHISIDKDSPTIMEFIHYYANKIKKDF